MMSSLRCRRRGPRGDVAFVHNNENGEEERTYVGPAYSYWAGQALA